MKARLATYKQRSKFISYQGQFVASFKDPSFQDRVASAKKAKQTALDQLKAKPPVDEALMAERRQARESREQVLAEERAAKAEANAAAKAEKAAIKAAGIAEAEAAAALKAARLKPASAADMKAARDARYAARKARK
ncbi:DUF6481 family protein [Sphingomonas sp. LY54]|uniref:DUF6481 family protein n=1 Tax=Sphingomonadales TaxID=204457 RepID=UPI002ADEE4EA|nr:MULTISPECIES: DUF6481 family protein [Sphingomonadales]MEA1015612.1 DUF6481 family protein [Sphingosinicella sp. LY1275]WRP29499.1 DUF6481 family protein [Sphingomonas sp. LY54]